MTYDIKSTKNNSGHIVYEVYIDIQQVREKNRWKKNQHKIISKLCVVDLCFACCFDQDNRPKMS